MRFLWLFLLCGVLALVFIGCGDGPGSGLLTVRVVNQLTGEPVANAEVRLLDSNTVFTTDAFGQVVIPNVPNELISLLVLPPAGSAPTLVGPFRMGNVNRTVVAETLTYDQLLNTYGVARPTNNTATVVAFGYNRLNGSSPSREVRLTVDTISDTGNPAVVTGIPVPPAGHNIAIVDIATDDEDVFPNFQLVANSVLVVRAAFLGAP